MRNPASKQEVNLGSPCPSPDKLKRDNSTDSFALAKLESMRIMYEASGWIPKLNFIKKFKLNFIKKFKLTKMPARFAHGALQLA
jgi:hypothetical protein